MGLTGTLDAALDGLLHDAAARARWLRGEEDFALDAGDRDALAAIDPAELDAMAASVRAAVWTTAHRGSGTLADRFPRTIAAWRAAHGPDPDGDAMMTAFLASAEFTAYREVPAGRAGASLEEAFFAWGERAGAGDAAVREGEFLAAMARALAVCPAPSFAVPARFRRVPGGWCAVSRGSLPVLYAAVGDRVLTGPITPFVAALLARDGDPAAVARAHAVDDDALAAAVAALAAMGLG